MRHIHLDPVGGISGDMFAAALLDAHPERLADVIASVTAVADVECRLVPHGDGMLTGARFIVTERYDRLRGDSHAHRHFHWVDIRRRIQEAPVPVDIAGHALGIFACLADAEGRVHGVPADEVTFHEVGAVDSIADILAAAALIASLGPAGWTVGTLPTGSGRIQTAHGIMPVPAPATALLMEGLMTQDDGIPGERVTPTGAAILRYLRPGSTRPAAILQASGYGFGTRTLPGISNCLRVLVFDGQKREPASEHRELSVINFEIDDQSGEDLAAGLERIRAAEGVHDVVQWAAIGKKGRMAVHVQVLARPETAEAVVEACFSETTTIGLRVHNVHGRALSRRFAEIDVEGRPVRVKLADRPGGVTAKAESDHLLFQAGHAVRARLRRAAEFKAETE